MNCYKLTFLSDQKSATLSSIRFLLDQQCTFTTIQRYDYSIIILDSATLLQSMQLIITAAYNQRSLQSTSLLTAEINHQI
jgi:hypothetical protein